MASSESTAGVSFRRFCALAICLALLAIAALPQAAGAARVRHVHFQAAGSAEGLLAQDPYIFLVDRSGQSGTLVNDQTGVRRQVGRSGCSAGSMGGAWLLFECGHLHPFLYGLSDGLWRAAAINPSFARDEMGGVTSYHLGKVGTHWIELTAGCYHCGDDGIKSFQNLDDGRVVADPTNRATITDLNSPSLARRICSPLRLGLTPANFDDPTNPTWGTLEMGGSFGLLGGTANVFLERCGSPLRHLLCRKRCKPVINRRAVIWQSSRTRLTERRLPSLRTFEIPLPPGAKEVELALTARNLYVIGRGGRLYTASAGGL